MKPLVLLLCALLVAVPAVAAQKNHITLLAVTDQAAGYRGVAADLTVEITPGTGKVYIDTLPLSKIDTQISTRFAKEIACQFAGKNCNRLDFFYTIRARSVIVAGPSAGGALAGITLATLENIPVNQKVSMTGTINSGGLIGPVSGIKEKIDAAKEAGLTTVLIPMGEDISNENGTSVNLTDYGKSLGIRVVQVLDLQQAMQYLTGRKFQEPPANFTVDPRYTRIMASLAQQLCNRTQNLTAMARAAGIPENESLRVSAQNATQRAQASLAAGEDYSAASFCFTANVRLDNALLLAQNLTAGQLIARVHAEHKTVAQMRASMPPYRTLTDLEAFFLVSERLTESDQTLNESLQYLSEGDMPNAVSDLAFATERVSSARSWSRFFGTGTRVLQINNATLESSCTEKIAEAEERLQYVDLFFTQGLADARSTLNAAYADSVHGAYDQCLFDAGRAKAQADAVLSVVGVPPSRLPEILNQKAQVVRQIIARQQAEGNFPIAGYSYYQYANSLRSFDAPSALLFYQYAMELSDLDVYFSQGQSSAFQNSMGFQLPEEELSSFVLLGAGLAAGFMLGWASVSWLSRRKGKDDHKRRAKARR